MTITATITFEVGENFIDPANQNEIAWAKKIILAPENGLFLHSNEIGDTFGEITKVENIEGFQNFTCQGCKHELPQNFCVQTPEFCYMCDPAVTVDELLADYKAKHPQTNYGQTFSPTSNPLLTPSEQFWMEEANSI